MLWPPPAIRFPSKHSTSIYMVYIRLLIICLFFLFSNFCTAPACQTQSPILTKIDLYPSKLQLSHFPFSPRLVLIELMWIITKPENFIFSPRALCSSSFSSTPVSSSSSTSPPHPPTRSVRVMAHHHVFIISSFLSKVKKKNVTPMSLDC